MRQVLYFHQIRIGQEFAWTENGPLLDVRTEPRSARPEDVEIHGMVKGCWSSVSGFYNAAAIADGIKAHLCPDRIVYVEVEQPTQQEKE